MRFSLPSIKCSAALPSFRPCCLNCAQRLDLITARSAVVGSKKEPPNIWLTVARNVFVGWGLNFRVRMFLKSAVKSQKSSRIVYQNLISDKGERPLSCQEKWHEDISSTNKTVDWRKVYQTSTACTRSSKLIDFNFRFLQRRLPTNSYLQKIGIREDNNRTFCLNRKEDLMHLFWQCEKTAIFWQNLSLWLQPCQILKQQTIYTWRPLWASSLRALTSNSN